MVGFLKIFVWKKVFFLLDVIFNENSGLPLFYLINRCFFPRQLSIMEVYYEEKRE